MIKNQILLFQSFSAIEKSWLYEFNPFRKSNNILSKSYTNIFNNVRLHDISSCRCFFYFKYNIVTQISQVKEVLTRFSTLTVSNKSPLIILNASILIPGYLSKANVSLNDKNLRHHQLLKTNHDSWWWVKKVSLVIR